MAKSVYISNLVLFVKKVFAMSELWAGPESITAMLFSKSDGEMKFFVVGDGGSATRPARAETW